MASHWGCTGMSELLLQHSHQSRGFSGPLQPQSGWHKYKAQGLWQWSALNGLSPYQPCPGPAKAVPLHGPLSFILSLLPHCPTLVRITCTHCETDLSPLCLPPCTLLYSGAPGRESLLVFLTLCTLDVFYLPGSLSLSGPLFGEDGPILGQLPLQPLS